MWWPSVALALTGVAVGLLLGRAWRPTVLSASTKPVDADADEPTAPAARSTPSPVVLDPIVADSLRDLPWIILVSDRSGDVALASDSATLARLVRRRRVSHQELIDCAAACISRRATTVTELTLTRPGLRRGRIELRVRAIPMQRLALLVCEDLTEEHRVTAIRRDFLVNVGHELKTPVGAISLLAEALAAAQDDPVAVARFAEQLRREAARLANLVADIINLSRLQDEDPLADPELIDVEDLVDGALERVRSSADLKGIQLLRADGPSLKVLGDAGQLEIVLTNLLANAIAYSDPRTQVALAVRESESVVEIDVKDQGIGIPDAEQERIFERFYRVDQARSRITGGTGLGLAIARNVCHNHGGHLTVWSVGGEGSTFTVRLPQPGLPQPGLYPDAAQVGQGARRTSAPDQVPTAIHSEGKEQT